jgi:hypothetical protein
MPHLKIAVNTVNEAQVSIGNLLGLSLGGNTITVAKAKLHDYIEANFDTPTEKRLTERQIEFAGEFGFDIRGLSKRVGEAVIFDILYSLDVESIERQHLGPGVVVYNRHDKLKERFTISSIREEGVVFFKGGSGRHAYARNLISVSD